MSYITLSFNSENKVVSNVFFFNVIRISVDQSKYIWGKKENKENYSKSDIFTSTNSRLGRCKNKKTKKIELSQPNHLINRVYLPLQNIIFSRYYSLGKKW